MIDYVDEACREWGIAKGRVFGKLFEAHSRGGWQELGMLNHLRDEAASFANGRPKHWFPEVFQGRALELRRAIVGIEFTLYILILVHYGMKANARTKVREVSEIVGRSISQRQYWDLLDRAHYWISGRMSGLAEPRHINGHGVSA